MEEVFDGEEGEEKAKRVSMVVDLGQEGFWGKRGFFISPLSVGGPPLSVGNSRLLFLAV